MPVVPGTFEPAPVDRPDAIDDIAAAAERIGFPVLLVHGVKDWRVQADHSRDMAKALDLARKPNELVLIKGAGHELERKSDRMTLLKTVEGFLARNLGPAS